MCMYTDFRLYILILSDDVLALQRARANDSVSRHQLLKLIAKEGGNTH